MAFIIGRGVMSEIPCPWMIRFQSWTVHIGCKGGRSLLLFSQLDSEEVEYLFISSVQEFKAINTLVICFIIDEKNLRS
jgi:hypothetical protein